MLNVEKPVATEKKKKVLCPQFYFLAKNKQIIDNQKWSNLILKIQLL